MKSLEVFRPKRMSPNVRSSAHSAQGSRADLPSASGPSYYESLRFDRSRWPVSIAWSVASIVPLSAARRIPTIACYLSVAIGLRTQANFGELRTCEVRILEFLGTSA